MRNLKIRYEKYMVIVLKNGTMNNKHIAEHPLDNKLVDCLYKY